MALTMVPLHVDVSHIGGGDVTGEVQVRIPAAIRDASGHVLYPREQLAPVALTGGEATVEVPATDQPDAQTAGWVEVTVTVTSASPVWTETRRIAIPHDAAVVEYADASVVVPGPASAVYATAAQLGAEAAARVAGDEALAQSLAAGLAEAAGDLADEAAARAAADAARVRVSDYADDLLSAIWEPAPSFDIPVATWSTGHSSSDLSGTPVQYRPAVCGTGSQATMWNGRSDPTETNFLIHSGRFRTQNGANQDLALYGELKPQGGAQFARWPIIIEFVTSSGVDELEIGMYDLNANTPGQIQIEVAGSNAGTYISPSGMGSSRKVRLTWPYAAARWIRVYMTGAMGLHSVRVPEGSTISRPPTTVTRRIAIIGDSFVNGAGEYEGNGSLRGTGSTSSYAVPLLTAMGAQDMILAGIGSTGFVAGTSGGSPANYITRIAEVLSLEPTALVLQGSVNDPWDGQTGADYGAVQAAVEACLAATDSVPERYVITVMRAGWSQTNAAIRAAVEAHGQGVHLIDLEGLLYGSGNPVDGGTGTAATLLLDDGVHPSYIGHRVIARQALRRIAPLLPA